MSCAEFERLLEAAIEGRSTVDEVSLDRHAADCPACRALCEQQRLLDQAIVAWQASAPEAELADAVLARLAFGDADDVTDSDGLSIELEGSRSITSLPGPAPVVPTRSRATARRIASGIAAVAAVVLLVAGWQWFRSPQDTESTQLVVTSVEHAPDVPAEADDNDAEVETLLRSASSAYRVLALDAASAVADASKLVAATNRLAPPETPAAAVGNHPDVPPDDAWERDLKPIGRQFGEALDFLFDVAPEPPPSI
ncbi:MAG: hypothetical protein WD648_03825 [Planctomycetaceae bacterium]